MSAFGKGWKSSRSKQVDVRLAAHLDELRAELRFQEVEILASRSGASYLTLGPGRGELRVPFWGNVCVLSFPELVGYYSHDEHFPDFQLALLLYYLSTADGVPLTGKWISSADLPDGRTYNAAFQSDSGDEIVKAFELNLNGFITRCLKMNGKPVDL